MAYATVIIIKASSLRNFKVPPPPYLPSCINKQSKALLE